MIPFNCTPVALHSSLLSKHHTQLRHKFHLPLLFPEIPISFQNNAFNQRTFCPLRSIKVYTFTFDDRFLWFVYIMKLWQLLSDSVLQVIRSFCADKAIYQLFERTNFILSCVPSDLLVVDKILEICDWMIRVIKQNVERWISEDLNLFRIIIYRR